jgi:hypothetical protein
VADGGKPGKAGSCWRRGIRLIQCAIRFDEHSNRVIL